MRRAIVAVAGLLALLPGAADGQAGSCQLIDSQTLDRRTLAGFQTVYIIAPVVQCTGGARITANEGTLYEATREIHMSGSVDFRDPERRLTSRQATYSSVTGRLYATGDVVFNDLTEGMTLRGPELEYYRAMEGRPQSQATATQRPHLTLHPRPRPGETTSTDAEPVEIDGDRMTMLGNEEYTVVGRVEIRRSDFQAFSQEARVDQATDRMELRGSARIEAEQFDLTGEAIDLLLPDDRLERILARRDAELVGEDLRIDSQEIQLFFADDLLQRIVARQEGAESARPVATARAFRLEADSIDARSPGQQIDQVIAIGAARGESLDTTEVPRGRLPRAEPAANLTDGDRDWILGDTVIGYFVSVDTTAVDTAIVDSVGVAVAVPTTPTEPVEIAAAAPDTAAGGGGTAEREVVLDRVVALGTASSLYRVENDDGSRSRPGLNYIVGDAIELSFQGGELAVADVRGLQRGLFLDPEETSPTPEPPAEAPADSPSEAPAEAPAAEPDLLRGAR